jgi:hypothetical protein
MSQFRALCALAILCAGCKPGIDVRQNPGPTDLGVRFYRPKPYLWIEPVSGDAAKDVPPKDAGLDPRGSLFKVSLQYLPDFSEEYSARVRTGWGTSQVKLTLENGWNLTSIDQNLDSKTAENVGAVTNLLKSMAPQGLIPGAASRDLPPSVPGEPARAFLVRGSNVPVGYYESVIARDPASGRKRLYGFRYVGFLPFTPCPIEPAGEWHACCDDESMPLYGLVFERGVMTFKPLAQVREAGHELTFETFPTPNDGKPPRPLPPPPTSHGAFQTGQEPAKAKDDSAPTSQPGSSTSIRIYRDP